MRRLGNRAGTAVARAVAASLAGALLAAGCAASAPSQAAPSQAAPSRTVPSREARTAPASAGPAGTASAGAEATAAAGPGSQPPRSFPAGFWTGTDSWPVPVGGSAPYRAPGTGGAYGGYIGMAGSWSYWLGCHGGFLAWSAANAAQADTDYARYHKGIGTAVYWFMGGPGVDPHYDGTAAEAYAWGARQAAQTLADTAGDHITYPVVFMDIEIPGVAPAFENGWNDVYTSPCSGQVRQHGMPVRLDRADFNGYWTYLTGHSGYQPGVYSAPAVWTQIFGTGPAASIPGTYEWTYEPQTASLADAPPGWCLKSGGCAQFFGGVTSSSRYAVMWQWSGGGGVRNAIGDFDQIDGARPA
jgi:hypothetical protein